MNSNASENHRQAVALARFSLVSRIQELLRQPVPLKAALDTVASASPLELGGQSRLVPRRTLEDWWYAYQRDGLPRKLYTDQGGPFTNDHTRVICANLDIRLLHAKPYHAWSKGKIERFFLTVQQDFEAALRLPGQAPASLAELNARLADWLQTVYHPRRHEGTGMSPNERFAAGSRQVRALAAHLDLDQLFYAQLHRLVRKDGTVRIDNELYEVDLALRGLEVRLRFDPWTKARVEVDYR